MIRRRFATGMRDAIVDGTTGFVVPADDPRALADALATLVADPALCDRLGASARQRALAHFARPRVWELHEGFLRGLVGAAR